MFDAIYQYILRLDVPMSYGEHEEIVKPPKKLIGINFDENWINFLLFNYLIEVV
jgi:hypothetical protein